MKRALPVVIPPAHAIGPARPSLPVSVYGEDFSLVIRRRRLRVVRGVISILH